MSSDCDLIFIQVVQWQQGKACGRDWILENVRGASALIVTIIDKVSGFYRLITQIIIICRWTRKCWMQVNRAVRIHFSLILDPSWR